MKALLASLCAGLFLLAAAQAQSPVTLTIGTEPGRLIPTNFCGLSFGAVTELKNHGGVNGHLFSPTNTQLITLFKNAGLRHLRIGGSTVEGPNAAVPDHEAIDDLFRFAHAAKVRVIYSLRLLNGDPAVAAADARYIWQHHRDLLDQFAIGNEPDIKSYHHPSDTGDHTMTNYAGYIARWRVFADAVTNAVPEAKFAGPDAANKSYAGRFAADEKDSGIVELITQHYYVGGNPWLKPGGPETIPAGEAISNMLSQKWVNEKYPAFHEEAIAAIDNQGIPWRMVEANDYLKGVGGASDALSSALWALDYLHWVTAHETNCVGVDFHNTEWLRTDTVYLEDNGSFQIHPKAYGIRAFCLGSAGRTQSVELENKDHLNLTAYAVRDRNQLIVTVINKEHGPGARSAAVTINSNVGATVVMYLQAKKGDASATSDITLGSAAIRNDAPWAGKWDLLRPATEDGRRVINVPASSAALVKITGR